MISCGATLRLKRSERVVRHLVASRRKLSKKTFVLLVLFFCYCFLAVFATSMEASEAVRDTNDGGLEKVTLLLGDLWLGRRTGLALTVVQFLAIKKKFVQIVVLASGVMLQFPSHPNGMLEVKEETTQADVFKAVERVMGSGYTAKLYKDQKRNVPLSLCEVPLGPIDNGMLYVDIIESFDSWKCLKTLQGHSADVRSVAFSPDGRTILSGSTDRTLKLW